MYQIDPYHQQQRDNASHCDKICVYWKLFTVQLNDQESALLNKFHYRILQVNDYGISNCDNDNITIISWFSLTFSMFDFIIHIDLFFIVKLIRLIYCLGFIFLLIVQVLTSRIFQCLIIFRFHVKNLRLLNPRLLLFSHMLIWLDLYSDR